MEDLKLGLHKCAWCHQVISDGDQHKYEGETICPMCYTWEMTTKRK